MNRLLLRDTAGSRLAAWYALARSHPEISRAVLPLVVPLSLIPPVMIYLAGTYYGDAFAPGYGGKDWGSIALIFLAAELASFAGMGWLVHQICRSYSAGASYRDAYLIAAVAPVPLWLSAFGLLVPSLAFNAAVSLAALGASCVLIYQGVRTCCDIREEVQAAGITQMLFGAGLTAWAVLLLLVVLPG